MCCSNWLLPASLSSGEVPRFFFSLWEGFQDEQMGLTKAPFKLLPLHCNSKHVKFCAHPLRAVFVFCSFLVSSEHKSHYVLGACFHGEGHLGWKSWYAAWSSCPLGRTLQLWVQVCSVVSNSFVTPWTVVHQLPLSMGLSWQEYWSGLPFPAPGDLPDLGIEPESPALADGFFTTEPVIPLLFVGCWLEPWLCHVSAPPVISRWFFLYVFSSGKSFLLVFRLFS